MATHNKCINNSWLCLIWTLQLLLWTTLPAISWAETSPNGDELEISNLVSAQVQSQIGHQFVKYFNDYWTPPEGLGNINIVIQERASPIWGSLIWVKVNDVIVYRQIFSSRAKDMKEVGKSTMAKVIYYILTTRLGNESDVIDDGPFDSL